jgi:hypothetical protein
MSHSFIAHIKAVVLKFKPFPATRAAHGSYPPEKSGHNGYEKNQRRNGGKNTQVG